jgi:hypothetical protein
MRGARLALAAAGIVVAAVTVVNVSMSAAELLTDVPGLLWAAATLAGPVAAILAVTGAPYHGLVRGVVVAFVVGALVALVSLPLACYAVAHMMGGGLPGPVFMALVYLPPAVSVLVCGGLALLIVRRR